jgi:hypothetical protein
MAVNSPTVLGDARIEGGIRDRHVAHIVAQASSILCVRILEFAICDIHMAIDRQQAAIRRGTSW